MAHYAEAHLMEIARKSLAAEDKLAQSFIDIAGVTPDQARALVAWYQRKKLVKLDLTNATLNVKHGAYLDADFIQHYAEHGAN